jgi:hypothetical protein
MLVARLNLLLDLNSQMTFDMTFPQQRSSGTIRKLQSLAQDCGRDHAYELGQ